MKRKTFLVVCLCLIMLITSLSNAQATTGPKDVRIYYSNLKLVVDGKQITVKDDDGKTVEPFVMDGIVYVPAKTLADLLKLQGQHNTKYTSYFIGKPTTKPATWVNVFGNPYLTTSNSNNFRSYEEDGGTSYIGGNIHAGEVIRGVDGRFSGYFEVTYPLNGLTQKVAGTIPKMDVTINRCERIYEFFDENNKLLYKSPIISENVKDIDFEFSTGKASRLRMKISLTGAYARPIITYQDSDCYATRDCYVKDLRLYTTDYK